MMYSLTTVRMIGALQYAAIKAEKNLKSASTILHKADANKTNRNGTVSIACRNLKAFLRYLRDWLKNIISRLHEQYTKWFDCHDHTSGKILGEIHDDEDKQKDDLSTTETSTVSNSDAKPVTTPEVHEDSVPIAIVLFDADVAMQDTTVGQHQTDDVPIGATDNVNAEPHDDEEAAAGQTLTAAESAMAEWAVDFQTPLQPEPFTVEPEDEPRLEDLSARAIETDSSLASELDSDTDSSASSDTITQSEYYAATVNKTPEAVATAPACLSKEANDVQVEPATSLPVFDAGILPATVLDTSSISLKDFEKLLAATPPTDPKTNEYEQEVDQAAKDVDPPQAVDPSPDVDPSTDVDPIEDADPSKDVDRSYEVHNPLQAVDPPQGVDPAQTVTAEIKSSVPTDAQPTKPAATTVLDNIPVNTPNAPMGRKEALTSGTTAPTTALGSNDFPTAEKANDHPEPLPQQDTNSTPPSPKSSPKVQPGPIFGTGQIISSFEPQVPHQTPTTPPQSKTRVVTPESLWSSKPIPRGAPCPCGSKHKYKKCCGKLPKSAESNGSISSHSRSTSNGTTVTDLTIPECDEGRNDGSKPAAGAEGSYFDVIFGNHNRFADHVMVLGA